MYVLLNVLYLLEGLLYQPLVVCVDEKVGLAEILRQIYYSMAFLGIIAAGGIFAGINPSYTVFELAHAIRTADITHLLVEPQFLPRALAAAKECSIPTSNIFTFDVAGQHLPVGAEVRSWAVLQEDGEEADWERFDDQTRSEETTVARLFSSGTTGLPKALGLSVWNFVSQHTLVMEVKPRPYEASTG